MKATKIFWAIGLGFLALFVGLSAVTIHAINQSATLDKRLQLAQTSYALHLRLESHVYQLFMNHDGVGASTSPMALPLKEDLKQLIRDDIAQIRHVIAQEIELVGEEEFEELEQLELVEREVDKIIAALSGLPSGLAEGGRADHLRRLDELMNSDLDKRFLALVSRSVAEEMSEIAKVMNKSAATHALSQTAIIIFMALCLFMLAITLFMFNRQFRLPLAALRTALDDVRERDFSKPFQIGGSQEFQEIGRVLNDIAASQRMGSAGGVTGKRVQDELATNQSALPWGTGQTRLDLRRSDMRQTMIRACNLPLGDITFQMPQEPAMVTFDAARLGQAIETVFELGQVQANRRDIVVSLREAEKDWTIVIRIPGVHDDADIRLPLASQILSAHGGHASVTHTRDGCEVALVLPKRCQMEVIEGGNPGTANKRDQI